MSSGTNHNPPVAVAESWSARFVPRLVSRFGVTAQRGVLAVVDQGVVSGTRFLTSIVIGRVCGPGELGDYALGFTLYCLAICAQEALITLPFTIFGSRLQGDQRRAFAGSSLVHFAIFALSAMLLFLIASRGLALGYGPQALMPVVLMLSITVPVAFFVEFARRFALARLDVGTALTIDVAMSLFQLGGLALLASLGLLSAVSAYSVVAVAATVSGLGWLVHSRHEFAFRRSQFWTDAATNLRFGRWVLASQLTLVARNSLLPWLLVALLDATQTGLYVACDIIVQLANPLLMAVSSVLIPSASRAFADGGPARVRQLVLRATVVLSGATTLLCIILMIFGDRILSTLLGGAYGGLGVVVSLLAVMVVAEALGFAASNGLWAIERPNLNFVANLLSLVVTLGIAAMLTPHWGIVGAACGALAGRVVASVVQVIAFLRLSSDSEAVGVER